MQEEDSLKKDEYSGSGSQLQVWLQGHMWFYTGGPDDCQCVISLGSAS